MGALLAMAGNLALELLPIAAFFVLLAAITKRGQLFAAWRRVQRESLTNLGLLVLNGAILLPLFLVPVEPIHALVPAPTALVAFWDGAPPIAVVLAAILLNELAVYWRHRLEHYSPWLWRFHATHHADEHLHWLSVKRKHPGSMLLSLILDVLPLLCLGLPPWAVAVAALLRGWWAYFIHADLPWTLGILGKVMISPAAHRLHHARDESLSGTNFGGFFTLWDRVFGTYCDPAPHLGCPTGIDTGTRTFFGELARPFEDLPIRRRPPAQAQG